MKDCKNPIPYPTILIGITNKSNGKILGSRLLYEPKSDRINSGDKNIVSQFCDICDLLRCYSYLPS